MSKAILVVKTAPASPEEADAYNDWYDNTHLGELLAIDGFTSAQRYRAADGESYLAIYELDVDVATAKERFIAAFPGMAPPVGVRMDPPPSMEYFSLLGG